MSPGLNHTQVGSVTLPMRSESEKLVAIPDEFGSNQGIIFDDLGIMYDNEVTEQPKEPSQFPREEWFSSFFEQGPSAQNQYPDPVGARSDFNPPYFTNSNRNVDLNQFDKQPDVLEPSFETSTGINPYLFQDEEIPVDNPKIRTNSGNLVGVKLRPDGVYLHPYNSRVLHGDELRFENDLPIPQLTGSFAPMSGFMSTDQQHPVNGSIPEYNAPPQMQPVPHVVPLYSSKPSTYDSFFDNDDDDTGYRPPSKRRKTGSHGAVVSRSAEDLARKKKYREPLYAVEAPKVDKSRPWVRVNCATKGNTRTGKTNNYGDGPYRMTKHPLGVNAAWTASDGTTFKYNQWGELHGVCWKASQLQRFFYEHPHNANPGSTSDPRRLIFWIQKMPGDSAKRVNTQHGLKCRVAECPAGIYKSRTINTGHYRVAFDEQWATYGDTRNPMHVAGYAHLYCMERFFDFKALCRDLDVRVDDRELPGEPTGEWVAALSKGSEEERVARDFIASAKNERFIDKWAHYPRHNPAKPLACKLPHNKTLTYKLVEKKAAATGHSKMKMMESRGRTATQFFVNMGDLQMQIDAQQERNAAKSQLQRGRPTQKRKMRDFEEDEDEDGDEDDMDDQDAEYKPAAHSARRLSKLRHRVTRASSRAATVSADDERLTAAFQRQMANLPTVTEESSLFVDDNMSDSTVGGRRDSLFGEPITS